MTGVGALERRRQKPAYTTASLLRVKMIKLRSFQRDFERAVEDPRYDVMALSGPRSLGKTWLAARILARCMTPDDVLH